MKIRERIAELDAMTLPYSFRAAVALFRQTLRWGLSGF